MPNEQNLQVSSEVYTPLAPEKFNKRYQSLLELWVEFLKMNGEENLEYYVHEFNLYEVITRHDKRKHYYKVFHELTEPCEYKYIAIECFWINTLKPFMVVDSNSSIYNCPNEMFSLFLIMATIRGVFENLKPGKNFEYISDERMRDILYDFKYCNLNREAMISFVETLADNYGVGIEYVLNNKKNIKVPSKISALWN